MSVKRMASTTRGVEPVMDATENEGGKGGLTRRASARQMIEEIVRPRSKTREVAIGDATATHDYSGFNHAMCGPKHAKYVAKMDDNYAFVISDKEVAISKRPGAYDAKFPDLRIISAHGSYAFELDLEVSVQVQTLKDIDLTSNSFFLKMVVQVVWLASLEDSTEYSEFYDAIKPAVVLVNDAGALGRDIFADCEKQTGTIRPHKKRRDGGLALVTKNVLTRYTLKSTMNVTIHHDFDPSGFPFDSQALPIVLRTRPILCWGRTVSFGFSHASRVCHMPHEMTSVTQDADQSGDFDIGGLLCMRIGSQNESEVLTMSMNQYVVTIFIQRCWLSFSGKVTFPLLMIQCLSVIAFWIPPCSLDARLSVSLTLFLTEASLINGISGVPKTAHMLPVHMLIIISMLMLLVQSFLFLGVRIECLDNDQDSLFDITLDPPEADEQHFIYNSYQNLDDAGLIFSFFCIIITLGSQIRAYLNFRTISNLLSSLMLQKHTPDLPSLEDYFAYIEHRFSIKQGGETSEAMMDAFHVDTAYQSYHKWLPQVVEDEYIETRGANRAVLIFDCGTGASKAILATSDSDGVRVLEPAKASDDETFKFEMKDVTVGEELKNFFFAAAEKIETGKATDKKGNVISIPSHCALKVVIGVSKWYRAALGTEQSKTNKKFFEDILEQKPMWIVERITALDECWYEMKAVQYAWAKYRSVRKTEVPVKIQAVLGVGSGSTQFSSISQEKMKLYIDGIELGFDVEYEDREALENAEIPSTRIFVDEEPSSGFLDALCGPETPHASHKENSYQVWKAVRNEIFEEQAFTPALLDVGNLKGKKMIDAEREKGDIQDYRPCVERVRKMYRLMITDWIRKKPRHHILLDEGNAKALSSCLPWSLGICGKEGEKPPGATDGDDGGFEVGAEVKVQKTEDHDVLSPGKVLADNKDGTYEIEFTGSEGGEMSKSMRIRAEQINTDIIEINKVKKLDGFAVFAISANFYGAMSATDKDGKKLAEGPEAEPTKCFKVKDVIAAFKAKAELSLKKLPALANDKKEFSNEAKEVANMTYLSTLYGMLFEDDVNIKFTRNWRLPADTKDKETDSGAKEESKGDTAGKDESLQFRTTWTAGWFLEHFDHPALVKKAPMEDS